MKYHLFSLLIGSTLLGLSSGNYCYSDTVTSCGNSGRGMPLRNCDAKYSAAHHVMTDLSSYLHNNIYHSFGYLLMSTNFNNYEKNREGLSKLYRKLSDSTWEDAIDLVKYITKRGGTVNFEMSGYNEPNRVFQNTYEMHEIESLSRALDVHKQLAEKAHKIHADVTKRKDSYHDAETLSFIEKEFVHKHADVIRDLAGYTNDLDKLIRGTSDPSLSIFLFDEYLKKTV